MLFWSGWGSGSNFLVLTYALPCSAAGGLTVAAVLKYADAVLKGYATAISVLLTGVLSMVLFGTELSVEYALGMTNVLAAVFLYNAQDLEKHAW